MQQVHVCADAVVQVYAKPNNSYRCCALLCTVDIFQWSSKPTVKYTLLMFATAAQVLTMYLHNQLD